MLLLRGLEDVSFRRSSSLPRVTHSLIDQGLILVIWLFRGWCCCLPQDLLEHKKRFPSTRCHCRLKLYHPCMAPSPSSRSTDLVPLHHQLSSTSYRPLGAVCGVQFPTGPDSRSQPPPWRLLTSGNHRNRCPFGSVWAEAADLRAYTPPRSMLCWPGTTVKVHQPVLLLLLLQTAAIRFITPPSRSLGKSVIGKACIVRLLQAVLRDHYLFDNIEENAVRTRLLETFIADALLLQSSSRHSSTRSESSSASGEVRSPRAGLVWRTLTTPWSSCISACALPSGHRFNRLVTHFASSIGENS